ncbi:unnamed protein product [Gongylonema pulchrum]|uniref:Tudor domain-containing protein n=1 Tax=Gongylonema pulchrum TaxID=637853 RepID=A0A183E1S1_9BILA|nr:unnamed protein product [Gongylonema pulchrum]
MESSPLRRHFKSVFPNHVGHPGLSAVLEISAIFRHYDTLRGQFTCTLKEDEVLYETLQLQMNEYFSNELTCCIAPRVKRHGVYAAQLNGCWKRVRVDRVDYDTRQCSVESVDDGQLVTVCASELFVLEPAFITNQYKRTFAVHFVMPRKPKRKCLAAAGFVDGHELNSGQFVNVFVFSDREPFLALLTKRKCLAAAGFVDGHELNSGQFVNVFVFSDREPFLALLTFVRIQAEKLVDDMDSGSARLWAATMSGEKMRCRGVAFGSYTLANLPCDVWCDVTVAAFESLEDVQVRGPGSCSILICSKPMVIFRKLFENFPEKSASNYK